MKIVARFEKVSFEQFKKDWENIFMKIRDEEDLLNIYNNIKIPTRSTKRSSGYDFSMPIALVLPYGKSLTIPTGIRCVFLEDGYDLICMPRSGLGFKYRLQLDNTIGLIDNDYYEACNEGHIMLRLTCCSNKKEDIILEPNKAFAQGVFREYFLAEEDANIEKQDRIGGFGSTSV